LLSFKENRMIRRNRRWVFSAIFGWLGIAAFAFIYIFELVPHHGPPVTITWIREHLGNSGLIVINILIVLAFLALLPYRRPTKGLWKSKGAFIAFVIALMTEMFGWPLLLFLLSPLVDVPQIARPYFDAFGHWPAVVGTITSFIGISLVAIGWYQIHRAETLVTGGLYRFVRHPQYTGLLLFTVGWILHWPSVVTLALWPLLAAAYFWLARQEEKQAESEYGGAYVAYAARTKRFLPFLI
ncbi:MAG: isoprenylcysteine carboxylmethyltransferase family protein, partial [Thermoanaerobaculia bacterium]